MVTDAQRLAKKRYDEMCTRQFLFRLRLDADKDVIEKLESVEQRTDYLREIVRRDIESEKQGL